MTSVREAPASQAGFVTGVRRVFPLALGQMIWSKRTMFIALIVGIPVLLAAFARAGGDATVNVTINGGRIGAAEMIDSIVWLLFLRFAVPVLGVWYGTSLIADEVDEKTITYLFVRPIRRGVVVIGKYLAYLACTSCLVFGAVALVYVSVTGDTTAPRDAPLWTVPAAVVLGLAAYGALFTFMGASLKRPLVLGLIFAFGWEPAALLIPGYLRRFTLAYHLEEVFQNAPSAPGSIAWLLVITAACLLLATRAVERREYVLEQ